MLKFQASCYKISAVSEETAWKYSENFNDFWKKNFNSIQEKFEQVFEDIFEEYMPKF